MRALHRPRESLHDSRTVYFRHQRGINEAPFGHGAGNESSNSVNSVGSVSSGRTSGNARGAAVRREAVNKLLRRRQERRTVNEVRRFGCPLTLSIIRSAQVDASIRAPFSQLLVPRARRAHSSKIYGDESRKSEAAWYRLVSLQTCNEIALLSIVTAILVSHPVGRGWRFDVGENGANGGQGHGRQAKRTQLRMG